MYTEIKQWLLSINRYTKKNFPVSIQVARIIDPEPTKLLRHTEQGLRILFWRAIEI